MIAFYSPGEGPVPFTYSAEVFPLTHREVGMYVVDHLLPFDHLAFSIHLTVFRVPPLFLSIVNCLIFVVAYF
jgi:hypothetical protein